jgi:hypothetical protein
MHFRCRDQAAGENNGNFISSNSLTKSALHGTRVAMYIVGQEETVGESSVSVVAGVRTVTTKNEWARRTPTFVAHILFFRITFQLQFHFVSRIRQDGPRHHAALWNARFCKLEYTLNRSSASPTD